jgi:4-alpha-glucanotransferase
MIGVALPLSFLRSKLSQGIGDLEDLKTLIDWCSSLNIGLIQLLPVMDTAIESSPYSSISSVALHPIYLRLPATTPFLEYLNGQDRVCYRTVYEEKMRLLKTLDLEPVQSDFLQQFPQLEEYAVFKVLKEEAGYAPHSTYPLSKKNLKETLQEGSPEFLKKVDFHLRLQQLLFQEWRSLSSYAKSKNIQLMGDLPILVSMESHEVFFHPDLFDLNFEVGAPPDSFAPNGQNWGQPIYDWEAHEKENYRFFLNRRDLLALFFDYYRIDHAIGFFRFWKIPKGEKGIKGFFSEEDPKKYLPKAQKRLRLLLKDTPIKPIAEDLGSKPKGMDKLLEELKIPGIKLLRWESDTDQYPENSLSTISLHDTSLLASWYREENGEQINDEERFTLLKASLETPSRLKVHLLQEYLALDPNYRFLYDEMEQINIPSTVLPSNWTIRMGPCLEDLKKNTALATKILSLIESNYAP